MGTILLQPGQAPEATPVLGPSCNGMLMTAAEFDAVLEREEGFVYELVHGVLVVMSPPLPSERGPNDTLGHWLLTYQEHDARGAALDGTLTEEYVRTGDSRRRADRVIWAGLGRMPDPQKDVPTVVVEFVSAGTRNRHRDYVSKRQEYLALGVAEYWIVDRFRRCLTVCRSAAPDVIIQENETYQSSLLPGFELALGRLLAVADRWSR